MLKPTILLISLLLYGGGVSLTSCHASLSSPDPTRVASPGPPKGGVVDIMSPEGSGHHAPSARRAWPKVVGGADPAYVGLGESGQLMEQKLYQGIDCEG